MMQDWLPETIAFYRTAAAHSDYYRHLAERISAHLPPNAHVCDAGCGLGELSLALLPFCGRVTAVDRAAAPMEDLRCRAAGLSGHFTPEAAEERLRRLNIPYRSECFALELGQPLRSLEEAERFFRLYNREEEMTSEEVRGRLQASVLPGFPYYLPNRKRLGLIVFSAPDVRRVRRSG